MPWRGPEFEGEFPSLGWEIIELWADLFPSPRDEAEPFVLTDSQAMRIVDWYSVHPVTGQFVYRRGCSRRSKGTGKSPIEAAKCITELALPCVFDGWDANGEPVARPWGTGGLPAPWVQIAALSEDQDDNTWSPLYYFLTANDAHAADALGVDAGLTRCFLRGRPDAKIEPVTSRAGSREGQPVTYGCLDETGLMTRTNGGVKLARTIRRNTTKMGGRSYETTNGFAPGEDSVAEQTDKAVRKGATGIFYDAVEAPTTVDGIEVNLDAPDWVLRRALEEAYEDCWWVNLDRMVADIRDPDQPWPDSERFFFNWNRKTEGRAVQPARWAELGVERDLPAPGDRIAVGFDGSVSDDSTALIGCTADGWSWEIATWNRPYLPDGRPDKSWKVPRLDVDEKVAWVFDRWDVVMYCDPPKWWTEIATWEQRYGEHRVISFDSFSASLMCPAFDRWLTALAEGTHTHDPTARSATLTSHVLALHKKKQRPTADDADGRTRYLPVKGDGGLKIDAGIADILAHEAAMTLPELVDIATQIF